MFCPLHTLKKTRDGIHDSKIDLLVPVPYTVYTEYVRRVNDLYAHLLFIPSMLATAANPH